MSKSAPSKKSLPAVIGGILLVLVAGYFGIDLGGNDGEQKSEPQADNNTSSDLATCEIGTLPGEASEVADTIMAGGPYDHPENDNKRFGNYEGVLPQQKSGYYREYTVETPGLNHRGERRIVTGGGSETDPDVWYYTDDHYESFCEIPDTEK